MAFPATRMRRLRRTGLLRDMVRETELRSSHLVQPMFVELGTDSRTPIAAMPGVERLSISHAVEEAGEAHGLGVPAVLLFGVPAVKDEQRVPVDARVVVSRTRDGGKSWDVLREGLPQEHAYDITLRHALDVDASGERLAFGSTTGSLWVSENSGDSWMHLSAHLPPIYAVRFA